MSASRLLRGKIFGKQRGKGVTKERGKITGKTLLTKLQKFLENEKSGNGEGAAVLQMIPENISYVSSKARGQDRLAKSSKKSDKSSFVNNIDLLRNRGLITEEEFRSTKKLISHAVMGNPDGSARSLSSSYSSVLSKKEPPRMPQPAYPPDNFWDHVIEENAKRISYVHDKIVEESIVLQMESKCFYQGQNFKMRWARDLTQPSKKFIVKWSAGQTPLRDDAICNTVKTIALARYYADSFNNYRPAWTVLIPNRYVVKLLQRGGSSVFLEEYVPKWHQREPRSHKDILNQKRNAGMALAAFAHFTYVRSDRQFVFQFKHIVENVFINPEICTTSLNRGYTVIKEFLSQHNCNSICLSCRLPPLTSKSKKNHTRRKDGGRWRHTYGGSTKSDDSNEKSGNRKSVNPRWEQESISTLKQLSSTRALRNTVGGKCWNEERYEKNIESKSPSWGQPKESISTISTTSLRQLNCPTQRHFKLPDDKGESKHFQSLIPVWRNVKEDEKELFQKLRDELKSITSLKIIPSDKPVEKENNVVDLYAFPCLEHIMVSGFSIPVFHGTFPLHKTLRTVYFKKSKGSLGAFMASVHAAPSDPNLDVSIEECSNMVWKQLKTIRISRCSEEEIDGGLRALPTLSTFKATNNKLRKITNLKDCSNIEIVDLTGNEIETVDNIAEQLPNARTLILCSNRLSSCGSIEELRYLQWIDLRYNTICNLRDVRVIGQLPKLTNLFLYGNPVTFLATYQRDVWVTLHNAVLDDSRNFKLDHHAPSKKIKDRVRRTQGTPALEPEGAYGKISSCSIDETYTKNDDISVRNIRIVRAGLPATAENTTRNSKKRNRRPANIYDPGVGFKIQGDWFCTWCKAPNSPSSDACYLCNESKPGRKSTFCRVASRSSLSNIARNASFVDFVARIEEFRKEKRTNWFDELNQYNQSVLRTQFYKATRLVKKNKKLVPVESANLFAALALSIQYGQHPKQRPAKVSEDVFRIWERLEHKSAGDAMEMYIQTVKDVCGNFDLENSMISDSELEWPVSGSEAPSLEESLPSFTVEPNEGVIREFEKLENLEAARNAPSMRAEFGEDLLNVIKFSPVVAFYSRGYNCYQGGAAHPCEIHVGATEIIEKNKEGGIISRQRVNQISHFEVLSSNNSLRIYHDNPFGGPEHYVCFCFASAETFGEFERKLIVLLNPLCAEIDAPRVGRRCSNTWSDSGLQENLLNGMKNSYFSRNDSYLDEEKGSNTFSNFCAPPTQALDARDMRISIKVAEDGEQVWHWRKELAREFWNQYLSKKVDQEFEDFFDLRLVEMDSKKETTVERNVVLLLHDTSIVLIRPSHKDSSEPRVLYQARLVEIKQLIWSNDTLQIVFEGQNGRSFLFLTRQMERTMEVLRRLSGRREQVTGGQIGVSVHSEDFETRMEQEVITEPKDSVRYYGRIFVPIRGESEAEDQRVCKGVTNELVLPRTLIVSYKHFYLCDEDFSAWFQTGSNKRQYKVLKSEPKSELHALLGAEDKSEVVVVFGAKPATWESVSSGQTPQRKWRLIGPHKTAPEVFKKLRDDLNSKSAKERRC